MENLIVPVLNLKDARKFATLLDGSYTSVTSKKGKKLISENKTLSDNLEDFKQACEWEGNEETTVSHLVLVPYGEDLLDVDEGDTVIMLGTHNWEPEESNPFGLTGKISDGYSDPTDLNVDWSNRKHNCSYVIGRDIIKVNL